MTQLAAKPWPYPLRPWNRPKHYNDCTPVQPLVKENTFLGVMPDRSYTPTFVEAQSSLPAPHWAGHEAEIESYWHAWQLAFKNTRRAPLETGFITPFIDTAFNDCLFMWDSVFILMFARYGERAFAFQKTLDNFYTKQHPSGFISRELREWNGEDQFHYADPNSTGPNTLHWSEWEYFLQFGDRARLAAVFPCLVAYHHWMRKNRSWPDGTYWTTGWGGGMDNQPRLSPGCSPKWEHDFLSWLDATAQAVFSARTLVKMAAVLGRDAEVADLQSEADSLTAFINDKMWNEAQGFYTDRRRDGSLSSVKSIGAYWTLLADIAPPDRRARLIAHLTNPQTFGRPHPIPSLSADDPAYSGAIGGDYWRGSVWPCTNYVVLRGLTQSGEDALAHQLARRHLDYVTRVHEQTGTFWENYHPEQIAPGNHAMKNFVGWGGVGPIAIFLEYVLGLRPDFANQTLVWDVRLTEAHGVDRYPFGPEAQLDLHAAARSDANTEPDITARSNRPVRLLVRWPGGERLVVLTP